MPNWKKLVTSGSDASLNSLNVTHLTASGLNYPSSDGSANHVLQTDGAGNLSFASVGAANLPPGVVSSSAQTLSNISGQDLVSNFSRVNSHFEIADTGSGHTYAIALGSGNNPGDGRLNFHRNISQIDSPLVSFGQNGSITGSDSLLITGSVSASLVFRSKTANNEILFYNAGSNIGGTLKYDGSDFHIKPNPEANYVFSTNGFSIGHEGPIQTDLYINTHHGGIGYANGRRNAFLIESGSHSGSAGSGETLFLINSDGTVGIGTRVSSSAKLEVAGTVSASAYIGDGSGLTGISGTVPAGTVSSSVQIDHDATTNFVAAEHVDHSSVTIGSGKGLDGGGTIETSRSLTLNTGSTHFIDGTVSALSNKDVDLGTGDITATSGSVDFLQVGDSSNSQAGNLQLHSSTNTKFFTFVPAADRLNLQDYDGTSLITFDGDNDFVLMNGGNVGIGTTSPQALLHVEGALSASGQITAADILPYADDSEYLGGTSKRWHTFYATRIQTDILREADGTNVLGMTGTTRDLYGTDGNVRISFEDDITFTNGDLVVPEYIYHSGDTDTFIRFQTDDINLTAGGSNLFRVDNTAPVREIVVNEAGAATNFRVESDAITAALFVTASTGNVGIGTNTPNYDLHVNGSGTNFVAKFESTDDKASILIEDDDTLNYIHSQDGYLSLGGQSGLDADNLNINSSNGNVGIGTTSPSSQLQVAGSTTFGSAASDKHIFTGSVIISGSSTLTNIGPVNFLDGDFSVGTTSAEARLHVSGTLEDNRLFQVGNKFLVVTGSNGNVGIGTTSPSAPLTIQGGTETSSTIQLNGGVAGNDNASIQSLYNLVLKADSSEAISGRLIKFVVGSTNAMNIDSSGNVGIGTTAPTVPLQVEGNISSSGAIVLEDTQPIKWATNNILSHNGTSTYLGDASSASTLTLSSGNATFEGNVTVAGKITAQEFHTEFVSGSIIYTSGSTKFGDTSNDIHSFSGSLRVTGSGDHYFTDGNVGIGTTSPSQVLHVSGKVRATSWFTGTDDTNTLFSSTSAGTILQTPGLTANNNNSKIFFRHSGGTNKFTFDTNAGSLGIGVSDPAVELEVGGSTNTQVLISTTNNTGNSQLYFGDSDSDSSGIILYRHANDSMAFEVGGAERMRISGSGNVGIGTTSPQSKLHINSSDAILLRVSGSHSSYTGAFIANSGTGAASLYLDGSNGDLSGNDYAVIEQTNDKHLKIEAFASAGDIILRENGGETMRLQDGNVGIGTASPSSKLHIIGTSTNDSVLINGGADARAKILATTTAARLDWQTDSHHRFFQLIESDGGFRFYDQTAGSERMRIDSSGNVGIGTTSPGSALDVAGILTINTRSQSTNPRLVFNHDNILGTSFIEVDRGTEDMEFYVSGSERMRITDNGFVGIGTSSPQAKLAIELNSNAVGRFRDDVGEVGSGNFCLITGNSANDTLKPLGFRAEKFVFASGNVGIGTTSPNQLLEVANSSGGATVNISTDQAAGSIASKKFNNIDFSGYNNSVLARIQSWDESSSTGHGYLTFHTFKAGGSLTEQMRIDYDGNVGIGTTSPDNKLVVADSNGAGLEIIPQTSNDRTTLLSYDRNASTYQIFGLDGSDFRFNISGNEKMRIDSSGNVGIGTTSPSSKLDVRENTSGVYGGIIYNTHASGHGLILRGGSSSSQYALRIADYNGTDLVSVKGNGFVGIGTTSPSNKLDVVGTVSASAFIGDGSGLTGISGGGSGAVSSVANGANNRIATFSGTDTLNGEANLTFDGDILAVNSTDLYVSGSRIGLGTASPAYKLHLFDDTITSSTKTLLQFDSNNVANSGGYNIDFRTSSNDTANRFISRIQGAREGDGGTSQLSFWTDNGSSLTQKLLIDSSGNVGIGTTSPSAALHVTGSAGGTAIIEGSTQSTLNLKTTAGGVSNFIAGRSDGDIAFSPGGSEKVTLTSAGRVGIGTTSPSYPLVVDTGAGTFSVRAKGGSSVTLASDASLTYFGDTHEFYNAAASSEFMRIDSSGNVGIGTTSPSTALHIDQPSNDRAGGLYLEVNGSNYGLSAFVNSGGYGVIGSNGAFTTDIITMNLNNGNVGIGSTPKDQHSNVTDSLNVGSHLIFQRTKDTYIASNFYYNSSDAGKSIASGWTPLYVQDVNNGVHAWYNSTAAASAADETVSIQEQMRIDSSGNVFVGKQTSSITTVGVELKADGNLIATRAGAVTTLNREDSDGTIIDLRKDGTTVGVIGTANSDLFIGTTNGSDECYLRFAFGGVGMVPATSAGLANDNALDLGASNARFKDMHLAGTANVGAIVESSTRKLKKDITELEDQSSIVDSLQPVSYTWKETEKEDFGLIAEDVADIAPHLVERDDEGNPTGIKYSKLSVLLLDVVQRQSTLIEDLNERITKLENERT